MRVKLEWTGIRKDKRAEKFERTFNIVVDDCNDANEWAFRQVASLGMSNENVKISIFEDEQVKEAV